jgi:RHS repeat-associated protein
VGLPTITYATLDGAARVTQVNASIGANPVTAVTYNDTDTTQPIGALMSVTLGAGDTQTYTYDVNTERMTKYAATVGGTPVTISGTLTWNTNGTLQKNTIADGYNSSNNQTCGYAYDDFVRVASSTCKDGSGATVWGVSYGYDGFGNITRTGSGTTWSPTYFLTNSHYSNAGVAYDADGNLTNDTFHAYTWLPDGHVASIDTATITYDALGNKLEETVGGVTHEYVSQFGVDARMTGQTQNSATINVPGGVQALYAGTALQRFRFPDWQGSIRAESSPGSMFFPRVFTESVAFDPFGERYALVGVPYNVDSFTGKPDQIVSDEYDFPARQQHNGQGRWISPDPASGTGNKYVYANNNPLSYVDPYGLSTELNGLDIGGADSYWYFKNGFSDAESKPVVTWQTLPALLSAMRGHGADCSFVSTCGLETLSVNSQVWREMSVEMSFGQPEAQNTANNEPALIAQNQTPNPQPDQQNKPQPNVPQEIKDIHSAYDKKVAEMTKNGERIGNGPANNFVSSLQRIGEALGLTHHHLCSCNEQAEKISNSLNVSMKDTSYSFGLKQSWTHSWVEGRSSVQGAPVLTLDPWKNKFEVQQ